MGSAFHQLCPRYSGTLTPTAPTAIRLWDTFTFTFYQGGAITVINGYGVFGPSKPRYSSIFSGMFSKRDNFCDYLFAYLEDEVIRKWGLLLKE